jgi:hypothetical protein
VYGSRRPGHAECGGVCDDLDGGPSHEAGASYRVRTRRPIHVESVLLFSSSGCVVIPEDDAK